MPVPFSDAVEDTCTQASDKVRTLRSPLRYAVQAMLAGAYVGVAVVLLASVGGPLVASGSGAAKLVERSVFVVALTLVVFAGAELLTSNNMVMLIGRLRGNVSGGPALAVNLASLVGNFDGSIAFAGIVHESGVLGVHAPGKAAAGNSLIASIAAGKESRERRPALLARGVVQHACLSRHLDGYPHP